MATDSDRDYTHKVPRVAHQRGMADILDTLERRWIGKDSEAASLRTLARDFNLRLFRDVLANHQVSITDHETETMYEMLKENMGDEADRTRVRRNLERQGVDIDSVESDFVTHQAVHTYLTKERGVSNSRKKGRTTKDARESVDRLQRRMVNVVESELRSLSNNPDFYIEEPDPIVSINVSCLKCGSYLDFEELLDTSGCNCDPPN